MMTIEQRDEIRYQVTRAMELYPNAHLGDVSRREDMQSAFRMIRRWSEHYGYLSAGVSALARDLDGYEDM